LCIKGLVLVSKEAVMTVINATRGCTLADRCELARTFWARGMGLMGRPGLAPGQALLIYPEWSVHTFFMKFAIDVLFLDAQDRVIGLRAAMPPNRPYAGAWGARYVLELPANLLHTTGTQVGDQLQLTPSPHPARRNSAASQ
jgi:hypothetical protein